MIVLLTDFGPSHYVGVMKGVIAGIVPHHPVIDLTHNVGPQNVREGAWLLYASYSYFPAATVFCAVVDPDVGGERQALIIRSHCYTFVGPDNGLLLPAAEDDGLVATWAIPRPAKATRTFEGRDVFAPAAARLAGGDDPQALGLPFHPTVQLTFHRTGREGEIVHIDGFGNLITNLPPVPGVGEYRLSSGLHVMRLPYHPTYCMGEPGRVMVTTSSANSLEIAVPGGSALAFLRPFIALHPGVRIRLEGCGAGNALEGK